MLESAQNPRLKAIRTLHSRKHRESEGLFLLETTKLVLEAVKSGWPLDGIYCTENWFERHRDFCEPYEESGKELFLVSDKAFNNLTTLESPEGVVGIARYPVEKFSVEVSQNSCFALAVGIQDPGNLGTLIRTADAAGATAIYACEGTADPYSPKAVRASMGSLFHLPVILIGLEEIVAWLKEKKVVVLATALGGESLYSVELTGAIAWMFGAEGSGLTEEQKKLADRLVEIPILGKAESLNVAAASAVCLYETVRRRLK